MKRLILILLFIVLVAQPCLGAINVFTTSIDSRKTTQNSYRWTRKPKDKLYDWAQEVEDRLDGTTANQSLYFSRETSDPTSSEGRMYYNTNSSAFKFHNGSQWITFGTSAGGDSLDTAYDNGNAITVDGTAVTLTTGASDNNIVLVIAQNETSNNNDAVTIANAGTGDAIQISPGAVSGGGINIIAKASGITPLIILDGSTNNIDLADNKGQLLIQCDDPYIHTGGTGLMILDSSTPIASAEGFLARFVHSGTARTNAYAVEIEVPNTQPALFSNGIVVITGRDQPGAAMLQVTSNDPNGNADTVDIHGEGSGDCLQITPDDTDSVALNIVGKASSTVTVVHIDGDTGDWIGGADDVAMVEIIGGSTANADAGGSLFAVIGGAQPKASTEGYLARFIATGAATASSWAVEIETTNTQGCLNLNNNLTISGANSAGTLLTVTGIDQGTDSDTIVVTHKGAGAALKMTAGEADSQVLELVSAASQTVWVQVIDGATGNWIGADDIGMLHLKADTANDHEGASLLFIQQVAAPKAASEGFLLRLEQKTGAAVTDAYAMEIEVTATTPCLKLNGQMTIAGQGATDGVLLDITSADTDNDTVQLTGVGNADVLQITPDAATAVALHIVGKASSSVTVVNIDGSTADWIGGADDVAMVEITGGSTANADAGGGLLAVISATNPAAASEGFLCRFIHTGTATTDAYAVEIETTATTPALMLNNQMTITGVDNTVGVLLDITSTETNDDTVQFTGAGSEDVLQITANATTATALNIVGIASTTSSLFKMDGSAGAGWIGTTNVGMIHILNDGTAAQTTATMLYLNATGTNVSGQLGVCARFIDGTTSGGGTEYAVAISSANNKGLWVDTGGIVVDDDISTTTLTVTGASTLSGTVTGDGGDAMVGFLHSVEVEVGTSEQLLIADSGKVFVNSNAGATTFTLPDAAAGLIYYFVDNDSTGAADIIIDCQIGDNIDHDTNGDAIESVTDAYPQSIILVALNGTDWATMGTNGTWGQQ